MADKLTLEIEFREGGGSTEARRLRRTGKVPGVLYGHGSTPTSVAAAGMALDHVLNRGGKTGLISLVHDGKPFDTVLVRDVQRDPVSRKVTHVDLQRVSATESVHAKLPIVTVGTAEGVRTFGGVMDVLVHEIEVAGPANALPEHLEVDVTNLGIHQHASAGDVMLPEGLKLVTPADTVVVTVEASKTARALEEAATGPAESAAPELVGRPAGEGTSA